MISLDWARKILAKGYDSSNRPKNGVTTAKVNGKEVTLKAGDKVFKGTFVTYDRYENQTPVKKNK